MLSRMTVSSRRCRMLMISSFAAVYEVSSQARSGILLLPFRSGADHPRHGIPAVFAHLSLSCPPSFPAAALPSPGLGESGGGERRLLRAASPRGTRSNCRAADLLCRSAGVTSVRDNARTTVYPCGIRASSRGPKHPLPCTPMASGTPKHESLPIERTVPLPVTRRQNGGSHRLPSPQRAVVANAGRRLKLLCGNVNSYKTLPSHGRG